MPVKSIFVFLSEIGDFIFDSRICVAHLRITAIHNLSSLTQWCVHFYARLPSRCVEDLIVAITVKEYGPVI